VRRVRAGEFGVKLLGQARSAGNRCRQLQLQVQPYWARAACEEERAEEVSENMSCIRVNSLKKG
jgi:hypothetical protein